MKQAFEKYQNECMFYKLVANMFQIVANNRLSCQDILSAAMLAVLFYERDVRTAEFVGTQPAANNGGYVRGYKAISFDDFVKIRDCQGTKMYDGSNAIICKPRLGGRWFCDFTSCSIWRKLGRRADIKVVKISSHNKC